MRTCAQYALDQPAPAILYYLIVRPPSGPPLCGVGVSNNSVARGFSSKEDQEFVSELFSVQFETGAAALTTEKQTRKRFEEYARRGPPVLLGGENTELFTRDVLGPSYSDQDDLLGISRTS